MEVGKRNLVLEPCKDTNTEIVPGSPMIFQCFP